MVPGTQRIEQLIQGETITRRRPVQNQVSTAEGEFSWKGGREEVRVFHATTIVGEERREAWERGESKRMAV